MLPIRSFLIVISIVHRFLRGCHAGKIVVEPLRSLRPEPFAGLSGQSSPGCFVRRRNGWRLFRRHGIFTRTSRYEREADNEREDADEVSHVELDVRLLAAFKTSSREVGC